MKKTSLKDKSLHSKTIKGINNIHKAENLKTMGPPYTKWIEECFSKQKIDSYTRSLRFLFFVSFFIFSIYTCHLMI